MLYHPNIEKLSQLRLTVIAKALQEQVNHCDINAMDFDERLGLLLDLELSARDSRKLQSRLRAANLRLKASFEDIDWQHPRKLDKAMMGRLGSCHWLQKHVNCLITGPTGVGKSWLGCALGHKACLQGFDVRYFRCARLLELLTIGHGDGSYEKLMRQIGKADLLIIDDFGIGQLTDRNRHDLLEILEDRYKRKSTLVTSQLPIATWHNYLGDPTLADAILDRLIHNAYRFELEGDSLRRQDVPPSMDEVEPSC